MLVVAGFDVVVIIFVVVVAAAVVVVVLGVVCARAIFHFHVKVGFGVLNYDYSSYHSCSSSSFCCCASADLGRIEASPG